MITYPDTLHVTYFFVFSWWFIIILRYAQIIRSKKNYTYWSLLSFLSPEKLHRKRARRKKLQNVYSIYTLFIYQINQIMKKQSSKKSHLYKSMCNSKTFASFSLWRKIISRGMNTSYTISQMSRKQIFKRFQLIEI